MGQYEKIGVWAFYIGLIITLVIAIISPFAGTGFGTTFAAILVILGIIVGLLNIQDRETITYLVASITLLLVAASLGTFAALIPYIGRMISTFMQGLILFVGPGAAIVAIKTFYHVARFR